MPPEARATIVVDSEDDPNVPDALAARASPPGGVVIVRPVPGVRELNHLAADLLIGLGKRFDALAREKQSGRAWALAMLWLEAEGTRHLVVVDADRLPSAVWLAMMAVARTTSAHVWLIASTTPPSPGQSRAAGSPPRVALAEFLAALPPAPRPAPVRVEGPLPGDDFLTFRASCRELLTAERFGVVDDIYRPVFLDTFSALTRLRRAERRPSEQWVLAHVRRVISTAACPNETLIRLRAAQAACFRLGLLVNLVPSLRPVPVSVPCAGFTPEAAARLRSLVSPELCAAAAIALAHPYTDATLLSVRSVRRAGAVLLAGSSVLPIPDYGRGLVEAHRLARLRDGASPSDPLFAGPAGMPLPGRVFRRRVEHAAELAGLGDPGEWIPESWEPPAMGGWIRIADVSPFGQELEDEEDRRRRTG